MIEDVYLAQQRTGVRGKGVPETDEVRARLNRARV